MFRDLVLASLLLSGLSSAAVLPFTVYRRDGPSGSVVTPVGNTVYTYTPGKVLSQYPSVGIDFEYNLVNQANAKTQFLDLYLEPMDGLTKTGATYQIAMGVQGFNDSALAYRFGYPEDACGSFNLVVIEHQMYNGQLISFRSAAPKVIIDCQPPTANPTGQLCEVGAIYEPNASSGTPVFTNSDGMGSIFVKYQVENQPSPYPCNSNTDYVSLQLKPVDANGNAIDDTTYDIVPMLVSGNIYDECYWCQIYIEYKFAPPVDACGFYELVVTEFQPVGSRVTATPIIEIAC